MYQTEASFHHTKPLNPWHMLFWLLFAQVLIAFVGRSLAPLGVFIGEGLSLTNAQIGLLPAALFLGQFLIAIPSGVIVDRTGTRPLLLIVSLCLGLSFALAALVNQFWLLLLLIAIGGCGYGAMHPTSNRGIIYWFSHRKRGTAMGIKQMGVTAGSAFAALLLVPLADIVGWRPVFIGIGLLLSAAGLLSYIKYRDTAEAQESRTPETNKRLTIQQLKEMVKNRPLLITSIGAMGLNGSQMCLNTYLIIYSTQSIGLPVALAAVLLVLSEASGSAGRIAWGVISDRYFYGNRLIIMTIIALMSAGSAAILALFPEGTSFLAVAAVALAFGFSVSGFNGLWMNAATELVPQKQAGLATGFSISLGSWGVIIGPPLFGLITDITGTFAAAWYSMAAMLVIIGIIFYSLHRERLRGDAVNA
ncbi:MFS transporter [Alteribacillus sp. HJP-4]|uniref:MFS transporter n=1 Tax=Alteribacillus sp. HJP-4 TaxID=2775394 RepID=UPI0035CD158D